MYFRTASTAESLTDTAKYSSCHSNSYPAALYSSKRCSSILGSGDNIAEVGNGLKKLMVKTDIGC
jgi:hypothetical protein